MPAVRWSAAPRRLTLASAAVAAAGCARGIAPPPALQPPLDAALIETSVFLIGDAGAPIPSDPSGTIVDPVLRALKASASAAPPSSTIVFLGDNVYERGIPAAGAPEFPEAVRRLDDQIAVARSSARRAVFVPGNHDWARCGDDGWASMQRADSAVAARGKNRDGTALAVLLPHNGCPGPETVDVGRRIRLIALDTNWWLHGGPKPGRATAAERAVLPRP